jgi:hypothetical protein
MNWTDGPPPGEGAWWIYWHPLNGPARVTLADISPPLFNPAGCLLVKLFDSAAFPFASCSHQISHHALFKAPQPPAEEETMSAMREALRVAESALALKASLRAPEQRRVQAALDTVRAALASAREEVR